MPSSPPAVGIFLRGRTWTQVEWYTGTLGLTVCFTAPEGVAIDWRWYAVGVPPYWWGTWRRIAQITLPAGIYTSLEFNPSVDTVVTRIASPC